RAGVGSRDDPLRRDEASAGAGGGGSGRHPPVGTGEAALPQPGSDPAHPRPLDQQIHRGSGVDSRRPEAHAGGRAMTRQSTQLYQVFIKASADRIWEAITKPEYSALYFHGARIENTAEHHSSHGPDGAVWGDGPMLEFDPPRRLVHEW